MFARGRDPNRLDPYRDPDDYEDEDEEEDEDDDEDEEDEDEDDDGGERWYVGVVPVGGPVRAAGNRRQGRA